ncbi:MAG: N-acetyl-gamma-glutamyl-phosphate reductase [Candidatus Omnitrophica bacterium]|nr:N-acetyl-gamma-glutamyl-phosphate reductase [Candidatus Omnitrophota bacterium]
MVRAGVVGATGYAGEELIGLLLKHPQVKITSISAKIDQPRDIAKIFPKFKNRIDLICAGPDIKEISAKCDVVFLALPHTVSMQMVPKLLKAGKKVIDLSADYRLKNIKVYARFYKAAHKDKKNLKKAVYGLPELYRNVIKNAALIANPGCYPTAAILALAPAVACDLVKLDSIIIDAKSGVSGAGRKASSELMFTEINEDFKAYKVNMHQHAPEIDQILSKLAVEKLKVTFVPHLLPLNRGILETIYLKKNNGSKNRTQDFTALYKKFYKKEPFIRIKEEGQYPCLKDVVNNNFCDIGIKEDKEGLIIIAAIDNLLKGASGQAVQNMNIMYKFPEQLGLI